MISSLQEHKGRISVGVIALLLIAIAAHLSLSHRPQPIFKSVDVIITNTQLPLGKSAEQDGIKYTLVEDTSQEKIAILDKNVRKAPAGYHWTAFHLSLTVKDRDAEFYTGSASVRLVDDKGRVYLPDYGAGAVNAPRGYARVGSSPFWTPAYLLKDNVTPRRIEFVPFTGAEKHIVWNYPR